MCASLILVSMVEFRFPFLLLFCDSSFVACVTVSFFSSFAFAVEVIEC